MQAYQPRTFSSYIWQSSPNRQDFKDADLVNRIESQTRKDSVNCGFWSDRCNMLKNERWQRDAIHNIVIRFMKYHSNMKQEISDSWCHQCKSLLVDTPSVIPIRTKVSSERLLLSRRSSSNSITFWKIKNNNKGIQPSVAKSLKQVQLCMQRFLAVSIRLSLVLTSMCWTRKVISQINDTQMEKQERNIVK